MSDKYFTWTMRLLMAMTILVIVGYVGHYPTVIGLTAASGLVIAVAATANVFLQSKYGAPVPDEPRGPWTATFRGSDMTTWTGLAKDCDPEKPEDAPTRGRKCAICGLLWEHGKSRCDCATRIREGAG